MAITRIQNGFTEHISTIEHNSEIHAQYWSVTSNEFFNINIIDIPESTIGAVMRAINEYKKQYPSTTKFRITLADKTRMVIDVTCPKGKL